MESTEPITTQEELEHLRKLYKELGWARAHVKALYDLKREENTPALPEDEDPYQLKLHLES